MSAAHLQLLLASLKKKKIRAATFHYAGEATRDLKKMTVSFKRSVRTSSGGRSAAGGDISVV